MRVLVCGSRTFREKHLPVMRREFETLPEEGVTIVHGGQGKYKMVRRKQVLESGADMFADGVAKEMGFSTEVFLADWNTYGKKAGPMRNTQMVNSGVDYVLAFWDGKTGGTMDTVKKAREKGIPVRLVEFGS